MMLFHRLVLTFLVLALFTFSAESQEISLDKTGAASWQLTLENPPPRLVPPSEIEPYYKVEMPGFLNDAPVGGISLPFRKWVFAVPPGMSLAHKVLSVKTSNVTLLPVSPGSAETAQAPRVRVSRPYVVDGYRLIDVEVFPAALRKSGGLQFATTMKIAVTVSGSRRAGLSRGEVPSYLGIVNPEFAWRTTPIPSTEKVSNWYRTGQTYVKIFVDKRGVYKISVEDLETLGIATSAIDPKTLRLFNRGVEQPLIVRGESDGRFDPGDVLLFFGDMNHDPGGRYFDMWTDENVYWLTWGGAQGKRFQETVAAPSAPVSDYVTRMFHFEEDHEYHLGDHDDTDERNSDYLPFETWVWKRMLKGDSLVTRINLPGIDPSSTVQLRVNLQGSSKDPSQLKLFINGDSAVTFLLDSYEKTERVVNLPASLFRPGENRVRWYAEPRVVCPPENPTCTIERAILDWFDLVITAKADALDGTCEFRDTLHTTPVSINARGFPDADLVVLNLDDGSVLTGLSTSGTGPYEVAFQAEPRRTYYAASESAIRAPARLAVDMPSSWKSRAHGADYIVITHAAYKTQAERLADYRASHDGFRTVVVNVEDIYDEFNDGIKHPVAIRRFLEYTYHNWQKPEPSFVVIMGDASWDPKYNMPTSNRVDYVPSWGRPADDNYFVAFNDSTTYVPVMNIGRIPAENAGMADDVIDKVIAYEAQEPMPYHQRVMFLNGGKNKYEHSLFRSISEALIRNLIDPYCMEPRRIYKSSTDIVSTEELDSIITEVNNGLLWINFAGHGGSRIIDVGIERPDIFNNPEKPFFFVTLSCNTAHFSEPFEMGLNELMMVARRNGAVATYGTSGIGIVRVDDLLNRGMFMAMLNDTLRTYGEIATAGKIYLQSLFGRHDFDANNIIRQYILLGDPATRIPFPTTPELLVRPSDITTDPETFSEDESPEHTVVVQNVGSCLVDSVDVLVEHLYKGKAVEKKQFRIPPFSVTDTIRFRLDYNGRRGENVLRVSIDPGHRVAEKVTANNVAEIQRTVLPRGVIPVFPIPDAIVREGDVEFLVSNPARMDTSWAGAGNVLRIEYAIYAGNDLRLVEEGTAPVDTVFTAWTVKGMKSGVYFWHARMTSGMDTIPWSSMRAFTVTSSPQGKWLQDLDRQFASDELLGTKTLDDHVVNGRRIMEIRPMSGGNNNPDIQNFSEIWMDGVDVSVNRRGFNVAVINRSNGSLVDTLNFDTYTGKPVAEQFAAYLASLDSTVAVAVAVKDDASGYPPTANPTNITEGLRRQFHRMGSSLIDSVRFRDSFAFFGVPDIPSFAREDWRRLGIAFFTTQMNVASTNGKILTRLIGPAHDWKRISWNGMAKTGTGITVRVKGVAEDGVVRIAEYQGSDATKTLPAETDNYPFIQLEAVLSDSTGRNSPALDWWSLDFDAGFPELGITSQSVALGMDSIDAGNAQDIRVLVYNRGETAARNVPVYFDLPERDGTRRVDSVIVPRIAEGERAELVMTFSTAGLRAVNSYSVTVDPHGNIIEYTKENNYFSGQFYVRGDANPPSLEILVDGASLVDDDYVSPRPTITINVYDESPLPITDTASVELFLDGRKVPITGNPDVRFLSFPSGQKKAEVRFTPTLEDGYHILAVNARDASGNLAGEDFYQVRFIVSREARIDNVFLYPNPADGPAVFSFRAIGEKAPTEGKIKIYTVAGRLIRILDIPSDELRIGFNRVEWDGLDQDGDPLANGVYFYKLVLKDDSGQKEFLEKMAILR